MSAFLERVRAALATKGYEVLRELGSGGMGVVVLARQVTLDRLVAVKVIRPEMHTALAVQRFRDEGKILASLSHDHIVTVYEADDAAGLPYYAMQYLEGETVADRLSKGPLARRDVRKLGRDLLDALEAAHTRGVTHRDVKPSNLFWDGKSAVLTDFGIAKRAPPPGQDREERTEPGVRPGTRSYMAPEQLAGGEASPASDLYAAALVIYEAYTARHWLDSHDPRWRAWWRLPVLEGWVLRRGLAWKAISRWRDAATFRRAFWNMLFWRYRLRALGLTTAGLVAGGLIALAIGHILARRPPSLVIRVSAIGPAESVVPGDSVACALARGLDRYAELSSHCVGWPGRLWPGGSHIGVEVVADGDAARIRLRGTRMDTIAIRGPLSAWRALADTLADRVFGALLGSEGSLDPSLPGSVLPKSALGRSAFRRAEGAFAHARYGVARAAYAEAAALDSTCWICYWRHAEVGRWFDLEDDPRDSARYVAHVDSFPEYYRRLIRAQWLPEAARLDSLDALTRRWKDFLFGQFRHADEILHRGPLVGRSRREALQSFQDVLRVQPEFVPALGHLAWLYVAEGDSAGAATALHQLEPLADPTDVSYESIAVVKLAFAWRFLPAPLARQWTERLVIVAQQAGITKLDAGARYLAGFGTPQGELAFAQQLQPDPRFSRSASIARMLALVGLGQPDSALALAARFPDLEAFADELTAALVLFDPNSPAASRWPASRASLETVAATTMGPADRSWRSAWMLAVVGTHVTGDPAPRPPPSRVAAALLLARAAAARGAYDSALSATTPFIGVPLTDDPFLRTVLYLSRAAWRERGRRPTTARVDLMWHENADVAGYPTGDPQPAEVDWAFAPLAQWKLGELLTRSGEDTAEACRAYRAVARLWAAGEPVYRARADSATRWLVTLHCPAAP